MMEKWREAIDALDCELLSLIAQRMTLARKIAKIKKQKRLPIYNRKRENEIVERFLECAIKKGIHPLLAKKICRLLLQYSRKEMHSCE